jgi:predicted PurR-regulated permease PerM
VGRRLLILQRRLSIWVLISILAFLSIQLAGYFADILRILGISVLLSYLLINVVDYLERFLRSRAIAILLVYVVLIAVTVVAVVLVVPAMAYQVSQMVTTAFDRIPDLVAYLNHLMAPLEARLQAAQLPVRAMDILSSVAAGVPKPEPGMVMARISEMAMSTFTWVIYAISILVASYYMLLEGHRMRDGIIGLFPEKYQPSLQAMTNDMDNSLQSFFRGQIVLALLAGTVMLGVYLALGIEYALVLAVFLGFWEIVPVIGPPIGFIPAAVTVAMHGMSIPMNRILQVLLITAIFNVFQQVKDNIIAPRYIGNVIGLHPILIFVAIMIGARLDGMLGIIFSLPVACVITVLCHHLPLKQTAPEEPRGELLQDVAEESIA